MTDVPDSTYGGDPANSKADELRLLIGDTHEPFELTDTEIAYFLSRQTNIFFAGYDACESIAGHYENLTDLGMGSGVNDSGSQRAVAWHRKAAKLYERATTKFTATGFMSSSVPDARVFSLGQFDYGRRLD